jgi:dinuclear metal center YbgI/SA1388 family protein
VPASPTVAQCTRVLEQAYDPATAQSWDAVGLAVGDPDAVVERVLLAVDPTEEVAREAVEMRAQLLVTHHPLFLRGVHGVPQTSTGGRVVATLVRAGCALFSAHTNADVARPGVSDALAGLLGLTGTVPLDPTPDDTGVLDKVGVYVPLADRERVFDTLAAAGAGAIGAYDRCGWWTAGSGTFRPLEGAAPVAGSVGRQEEVAEARLEMVLPRRCRAAVLAALRATHPYEEPAFDLVELVPVPAVTAGALAPPTTQGLGRVGDLPRPQPLSALVRQVTDALPRTACGVRATGDPDQMVRRLAVCGGSGGELAGRAAALGADAFLTADGRHHYVLDAVADHGVALIDAAHWATEWPWLADAQRVLLEGLAGMRSAGGRGEPAGEGDTVTLPQTAVSTRVTDPWRLHAC